MKGLAVGTRLWHLQWFCICGTRELVSPRKDNIVIVNRDLTNLYSTYSCRGMFWKLFPHILTALLEWNWHLLRRVPRSIIFTIITSYHLICPPLLPDLRTVRLIRIRKVIFYRIFEFPKLLSEPILQESVWWVVIAIYNYATFMEVELVFWAFGIIRFRAEYCMVSETKFNGNVCYSQEVGQGKSYRSQIRSNSGKFLTKG